MWAKSVSGKSAGLFSGESLEHKAGHTDVDVGLGVVGSLLIFAGEATGLVEPAEGALDNPALFDELKAFGIVAAADDCEVEFAEGTQTFDPCDQSTCIASVGPDDLQPAEEQVEARQEHHGTIAILNIGRRDPHSEDHAEGVHEQVSLAPADLLARIVADRFATLLGAFDALAVEDGGRWGGLAAFGDANLDPQATVELFPEAVPATGAEVIEDGGLGRKVLGQHAPLAPGPVEIEDGVENGSARVGHGSPVGTGLRKERLKELPFEVGEVTGIGLG